MIRVTTVNVYDLVAGQARQRPHRPAVVFGERRIEYKTLVGEAEAAAGGLRSLGIGRGDRVAVLAHNRPEILVLYLAAARIGGIFVPINPELKPREVAYILSHAEPAVVVCEAVLRLLLEEAMRQSATTPCVVEMEGEGAHSRTYRGLVASPPAGHHPVDENDGVLICYTSGSTGRPKGIFASHRNEIASATAYARVWHIGPTDRVAVALPLAYLYGLTTSALTALGAGATVVLLERFHPVRLLEVMEAQRVTVFMGVPTMYAMMASHAEETGRRYDLSALRVAVSAGAALPPAVADRFRAQFSVEVREFYALSEIRPVFLYDAERDRETRPRSSGRLAPDVEARIIDVAGRPVRPGEVGELLVRSPTLMKGYYRDPERTAEAMVDGWFRTGDLARVDPDGFYYIVGRTKDLIIRGGANIAPAEVEEVLLQHPAVAEAAVVGVPDPVFGENVKAAVVLRPGASVNADDLRAYCREYLAEYKVPAVIEFLPKLPIGPTGKVLKGVLRETRDAGGTVTVRSPEANTP